MGCLVTIIAFIIVFGVLVTVHEYGHMFFAKRVGIICPGFAIGMGPKIFSFRKNEALYTIRSLPVGEYVRVTGDGLEEPPVEPGMNVKIKLSGENGITYIMLNDHHKFQQIEAIEVEECSFKGDLFIEGTTAYGNERHHFEIAKKSFFVESGGLIQIAPRDRQSAHKKPWPKFLILFAGPLFNFILALVLFISLAYYQGTSTPAVEQVADKYLAQQADLQKGGKIVQADKYKISEFDDVGRALDKVKDNKTTIKFECGGKTKSVELTPKKTGGKLTKVSSETKYVLGFRPASKRTLFKPVVYGFKSFLIGGIYIFSAVVGILASIFTGGFLFDMLNGPVGIYRNVDSVAKAGIINLIGYTALLSVNLGITNLTPIPALDGGRILFVVYEAIFRKPVNKEAETTITTIGTILMVVIMISITWDDIR